MFSIPAVHLDDGGLVTIGIGIRSRATERLGPVSGKSLNMLRVEAVAERMGDNLVGHHPTMPGLGKTPQAIVTTRRLEDRLHASIIASHPCLCKVVRAVSIARHPVWLRNTGANRGSANYTFAKSMAKRIGVVAIGLIVLVTIVACAFFAGMQYHFHPSAPRPHYPPPATTLEAQRQDIQYFRQLIALDRSFAPNDRAEANRELDALESSKTVLDRPHFRVSLMRIDALADNGHSRVENERSAASLELPVRVTEFSDGLYIMRATEMYADLLGSRITEIDGQSIDAVITKLQQLRGGAPQWRRLHASQYLAEQDLLYGMDVAPDMQHTSWTVETPSGKTITRRLNSYAPPANEPAGSTKRWLSSEPLTSLAGQWRAVEPDHSLPISLTDFDKAFRRLTLPGTCTEFVQFKSNTDDRGQSIADFVSSTERRLRQLQPCNVILDLRYNSGGNFVNTYGFARDLPKLVPPAGKIIVLTGPATFSAGISTAAFVKHAGQERVVIVGEPVGDRLQFFSEGGRACLPNSRLCVAYETGKHDYQHACTDWNVCFWLNYFFQFRVKSLDPDEVVPWSFKDWQAGIDPVLDRAITLAAPKTGH